MIPSPSAASESDAGDERHIKHGASDPAMRLDVLVVEFGR
jgi:hypothetical protein